MTPNPCTPVASEDTAELAAIDASWPSTITPVKPPQPLPALAAELVSAHRARLALADAVVAAEQALADALAHEDRLRLRVETAMGAAQLDRVTLPGAVVSFVSARIRRGDPEGTVIGRSGLRVRLRAQLAPDDAEPLFAPPRG